MLSFADNSWAKRRALVVGNASYAVGQLRNPANDATEIAASLTKLGFDVTKVIDLRRDQIGRTQELFLRSIGPADEIVFFYAGHGIQVNGVNYLLAVDAKIETEGDIPLASLNLSDWIERLESSRASVRLLIIDACRDNPFSKTARSSRRGLARVESATTGTLMHFATRPGGLADDGVGKNGLYTTHLLRHLNSPGIPVELMLKRVAADVRKASTTSQQPWLEGALEGEFYFLPLEEKNAEPPMQLLGEAKIDSAKTGAPFRDCSLCPALVGVRSGTFVMGSASYELDKRPNEGPPRVVTISKPFYVGKTEVTVGEFRAFVRGSAYVTSAELSGGCHYWDGKRFRAGRGLSWINPGFEQDESHPAVCISWKDAKAYVDWLNVETKGKDYRLLSETEWEFVAKDGKDPGKYPWGEDANGAEVCRWANSFDESARREIAGSGLNAANCNDGYPYTAPSNAFPANGSGVLNMHGNAAEWVEDRYNDSYFGAPLDERPWVNQGMGDRRSVRGGSWFSVSWHLSSTDRQGKPDDYADQTIGFRIAKSRTN